MRDLMKSDRNRLVLTDPQSGEKIGIYYATPSASVLKAYRQASVQRSGNKVAVNTFDPALKYGLQIITGFDDGAFGYDGKPVSSDPQSPDYREDWKALLAETAADIVAFVGTTVLDGVRSAEATVEFAGAEAVEDVVPFGTSSRG